MRFVMIFKDFIQGNLILLCMKIINSMILVGFYYGFLTTLSIGPSYVFFLQKTCIIKENKTKDKVSATTGFIIGQLMLFISIYYAPLHLALGRPHTTTILIGPYLLFYFFWNNHKYLFDFESTTKNSMRNISIQCIFLNNFIFQLFNHFNLPSSMLARLVNIYMFRCNNKFFFVTSSFLGWLIGHILFLKWVGLVLVWIRQNNFIKSNVFIRFNKYFVSELINSMAQIFCILLFITCVYNLGRIPSPILTKKFKEPLKRKERRESEEETYIETEKTYEMKGIKKTEQEVCIEEDLYLSFLEKEDPKKFNETKDKKLKKKKEKFYFNILSYKKNLVPETVYLDENPTNLKLQKVKNKEDKNLVWFEKPLVPFLFDYKRWNRPLRYIKNDKFENAIINKMSQYFLYTCQSDGKLKITFTYLPSLFTFLEMIQRKRSLYTLEKLAFTELYNYWIYTNEQKMNKKNNGFISRIETLDKDSFLLDIIEKRSKFCNYNSDKKKYIYLPTIYDPFLNGSSRGTIKKKYSSSIISETPKKNTIETLWINKIHGILFIDSNKSNKLEKKTLATLISKSSIKSTQNLNLFPYQGKINSKNSELFFTFLFDAILTDTQNKKTIKKKYIAEKNICKKVSQRSYKLIDGLEQQEGGTEEDAVPEDHQIRSRKANRVVIFTDKQQNSDTYNTYTKDTNDPDQMDEVTLIRYSQQSDFRRDLIKGSMRPQRRKTFIFELFQTNIHSPFFLDRKKKLSVFLFQIFELMKFLKRTRITEVKISNYPGQETKKIKKNEQNKRKERKDNIEITETCDTFLFSQRMRGCMLVTQSFFRKKIILPSLIIAKNLGRMFLFQFPEWSEDLEEWNREMHVKCTYTGVQLSETEFPKNWLTEGIQIKILFPFCLKPWHGSKSQRNLIKQKDDFCFLTVWGMETKQLLGSPRKRYSFFKPIFKKLEKKTKRFLTLSKEMKIWIIDRIYLKKKIILSKVNSILLFGLKERKKLSKKKKEKYFRITNQIIHESSIQKKSIAWLKYLLVENKIKNLTDNDKINTIINKIEKITKEKKKVLTIKMNLNKINFNAKKRQESSKNIFHILQKINVRLIQKLNYFFKYYIEKIYLNFLLYITFFYSLNAERFLESTKTIMHKYSYKNEENKKKVDKTKQTTTKFFSTKKKSLSSNNHLHIFFNLSFLSQTYVFLKLSKRNMNNMDKLRYVLQYRGTPFFIKNEIKKNFETQAIFHSNFKLRYKKLLNYERNQWTNWLRAESPYNLSPIRWCRLMPQKWRTRINQNLTTQNKNKGNLYELYKKAKLINYEKEHDYEVTLVSNQKNNFKKHYRYDFFSYKNINIENRKDLYIFGSPLQQIKKKEGSYYNYNTHKRKLFDILWITPLNNEFRYDDIKNMGKNLNKKSFYNNKYLKTENNSYKIIDTKSIFYFIIHQQQKITQSNKKPNIFNWMGMNNEIKNRPVLDIVFWFFPEFLLLYNGYTIKPWVIPIKFFLFNFNEKKNTNARQIRSSNVENFFALKNRNPIKKEAIGLIHFISNIQNQENRESLLSNPLSNQQKYFEYERYNIKKHIKTNQYKSNTEAEIDFFLKSYLLFQLRWYDPLNQKMINNIKLYCFLLRLINPKEIVLSFIRRGEMSLDLMLIPKNLTLTELPKKGILIIEPIHISVKSSRQFIIYQTLSILLIHKSKYQINQRYQGYQEQRDIDQKKTHKSITRHQIMLGNKEQNYYDLLVPENILSPRRCKEFRILICFNSRNLKTIDKNLLFCNEVDVKNCGIVEENPNPYFDINKFLKLKFFLWPNFRLEDLICTNRYWFDTNNGSRFSMFRIHMYPQLKIR